MMMVVMMSDDELLTTCNSNKQATSQLPELNIRAASSDACWALSRMVTVRGKSDYSGRGGRRRNGPLQPSLPQSRMDFPNTGLWITKFGATPAFTNNFPWPSTAVDTRVSFKLNIQVLSSDVLPMSYYVGAFQYMSGVWGWTRDTR
jgi:hypothetical protein